MTSTFRSDVPARADRPVQRTVVSGHWALRALGGLCLAAVSCSEPGPMPSGAICPPNSALSYENFGEPFMERYCTRCHSSELRGAERQGAPLYHDFDSLFGVLAVANHVDEYSAAGPKGVNEVMPPGGATPTTEERYQLGEWLACEVEALENPADAGAGDAGAGA